MYTLTISLSSLEDLNETVKKLSGLPPAAVTGSELGKVAKIKKIKVEGEVPLASPEEKKCRESAGPEVTYDSVKDAVFMVAKNKGREASLDLLAKFGVVKGEGNDRKGVITDLKPEQYASVVGEAKKALV